MGTSPQEKRVDASSPAPALVPRKRRTTQNVRHLADAWPEVIARVRAAGHRLLLLDFDGTLVGLRRHPDDVRFSERGKKILRRLVGLENLLLLVPFILLTQAALLPNKEMIWAMSIIGGLMAVLRLGSLKWLIANLNFPPRLLWIGFGMLA